MKWLMGLLVIVVGCALNADPAAAAKKTKLKSKLKPDQIQISYIPPKNPEHEPVFRLMKDRQVLEKLKGFLSPLLLPRPLLFKLEGCDGKSNAWYEDDAITVCYEYIADLLKTAPKETTPAGVTRDGRGRRADVRSVPARARPCGV